MNYSQQSTYTQEPFSGCEKDALDKAIISTLGNETYLSGYMIIPSAMPEFKQTEKAEMITTVKEYRVKNEMKTKTRRDYLIKGELRTYDPNQIYACPCGCRMQAIGTTPVTLQTIPINGEYARIKVECQRLVCPNENCTEEHRSFQFPIPFKADRHRITLLLEQYTRELLAFGLTLKEVSHITGLNKNIVKEIDKKRLSELYTVNGEGKELKKPEEYCETIAIDEFKLHDGHKYATVIIDLKTGHVLYLATGKKKEVVYKFIEYVGMEWMEHVKAVACDMNSDFFEAFHEKCPWIEVVFDHFHLVKNFNDKVVSEVRKDEQKRLIAEGNDEAAKDLKGTKHILTASRKHLRELDQEGKENKVKSKGSVLFAKTETHAKCGYEERYDKLLIENKLLFTCDLIKEKLEKAYTYKQAKRMRDEIQGIIDICRSTKNTHFEWYAKLLENHIDGIVAHAKYHITSGKIEGINNKTKTIRRKSYGLPDDEYFFLKIIDASYQKTRFS